MTFSTSGGSSFTGVVSLKWYFLARASKYIREMESPFTLFQPEATIAPSRMDRSLLGRIRSSSTFSWEPKPLQVGQAP